MCLKSYNNHTMLYRSCFTLSSGTVCGTEAVTGVASAFARYFSTKCFSSKTKFLRLHLYMTLMKSPTMGISPIPKSKAILYFIFRTKAGGNPPSIFSAVLNNCIANVAAIMSPIHGIRPIMPAQPKRIPQILNCKSKRYAFRLTEFKIFKSCLPMKSGSFLFLLLPFFW
ncbi:hypothetical protein CLUG_03570 [Clavispora lusitaniae ATCC 42720]|uniref:Uncharacterized protein n=1 Tax=Clavispora lusitaniae (strain ATCC 42720) TaxID=306902 RepID=C4Y5Y6_CLAL4|nr:uncharacterized protein CLUG_03570 [Clavispora lusitaniae ATCC 42720]EEQ39442.1 hypothetical protein CLUG_03570 [Clavispora lusitaniae ATCC 42720]